MKSGKISFPYLHTKQNFFPDWKMRKSLFIFFHTSQDCARNPAFTVLLHLVTHNKTL